MHKIKWKFAIYIVAVLWIAAFSQIVVNEIFSKKSTIMEAFSVTNTEIAESHLEITAYYGNKFLTDIEKKEVLEYLATGIGLTKDYDIKSLNETAKRLTKKGNSAKTAITFTSDKDSNKQYIHFELNLFESPDRILYYKNTMEKLLKELSAVEWQTTLNIQSIFPGQLDGTTKEKLVEQMLKTLSAKVISKNEDDNLYTIYAYSNLIKDYLTVNEKRININIAVRYNETNNTTLVYLATPILNEDY